jgi:methionyl-tRNA formyltransferase
VEHAEEGEGTAASGRSPRIVMVTVPSKRADSILTSLLDRGLPVEAVVVDRGKLGWRQGLRRTRQVLRKSGIRATVRRIRRRLPRAVVKPEREESAADRYRGLASAVHQVEDINSGPARRLLSELQPDLVVLGTSRILKPPVIDIARRGVLNAHPGLLPAYRGVDVIAWAVLNDDPLGVTVHWVDSGIDTGPSVAQQGFEVRPGDTLSTLQARADALAGQLMADVVERIARGQPLEPIDHGDAEGSLYTRMSPTEKRRVREILAGGGTDV